MKPATLALGAAVIGLACGSAGYLLGSRQTARTVSPAAKTPAAPGRPVATNFDAGSLRRRLDAETHPLARFKLAIDNLEAWVARDPQGALAWLASQPVTERRDDLIRMALHQFSETDAKGAADWASGHLTGDELNNALIAIAENWAAQNGREAAEWFLSQPATQERDAAVENLFFAWASNEPAAAVDFIKAHPDLGDLSPTLLRAALAGWAKSDPQGAVTASLAISRTRNDPDQFANTLANWATMDLDASSRWLMENLPAGAERSAAAQELAVIFASQSPEAGITWLEKLETGPERDAAAGALAAAWSRSDPAGAAKWIASQATAGLDPGAVAMVARNFLRKDAAAFETWRAALPAGTVRDAVSGVGVPGEDD